MTRSRKLVTNRGLPVAKQMYEDVLTVLHTVVSDWPT